jgi:integrase/recombinase XerD
MADGKPGRPIDSGLNGRKRVLTEDEVRRLKAAADESGVKYALIIRLILQYAMRSVELSRMKVVHFDMRAIPPVVRIKGAKKGSETDYEVPDKLLKRCKRWLKVRGGDSQWLFPSRSDAYEHMSPVSVQQAFKALCARAGITDRSVHDLRHTSLTRCARAGDNAARLCHLSRHKDLESVGTYIDTIDDAAHSRAMAARYED